MIIYWINSSFVAQLINFTTRVMKSTWFNNFVFLNRFLLSYKITNIENKYQDIYFIYVNFIESNLKQIN
jgi:hypothetical protein